MNNRVNWFYVGLCAVFGGLLGAAAPILYVWLLPYTDYVWTVLWCLWFIYFLAVEIPAVLNKTEGDTLSEHIWRIIGLGRQRTLWTRIRRIAFVSFSAWLVIHIFTGWI